MKTISYLNYYWEFYGKDHPRLSRRFQGMMKDFRKNEVEAGFAVIKRSKLTNTVGLSSQQFELLQQLVTLTNTLEQMSKKGDKNNGYEGTKGME